MAEERNVGGSAGGGMKETAREAQAEAKAKVEELKDDARAKGEEVKARAREEGESRKAELSERIRSVTFALERAADSLDERGEGWLAEQARGAAGKVEDLTGYLDDRDVESLMGDLQDTARSNPGTFLGGSFAAGMALGRFLRASTPESEPLESTWEDLPAERGSAAAGEAPVGGTTRGYATSQGYMGRADEARGRWRSQRGGEAGAEPERPGVRTGGSAMASQDAGSGRMTAGERSEESNEAAEELQRSRQEEGGAT